MFGLGIITDFEGQGASARIQVKFDSKGSKWLVLSHAPLEPA
jgi:DNA helicase-2/ATP-dependent DNA helicase PcrA